MLPFHFDYNLILASGSPRRKELLEELGIPFRQVNRNTDESFPEGMLAKDLAVYLAEKKANHFPDLLIGNNVIITCDTFVYSNGKVLNKPENPGEANRMLSELSGNTHSVFSGVCVCSKMKKVSFYSETLVTFRVLDQRDITHYIQHYQPFDKAGAYGIQEWIGKIGVERIQGCYYNVVGLPLSQLYQTLKEF